MDTYGLRKTVHVFGAVSLCQSQWSFQFADVFNGTTFHTFLRHLVQQYAPRKVFLIMDNGPCHWLDDAGKLWVKENPDKIELHRLPAYSPEFNPVEGVWKTSRRRTTHNRFYHSTHERDAALTRTFTEFQQHPALIANHVKRFQ